MQWFIFVYLDNNLKSKCECIKNQKALMDWCGLDGVMTGVVDFCSLHIKFEWKISVNFILLSQASKYIHQLYITSEYMIPVGFISLSLQWVQYTYRLYISITQVSTIYL
jgi:hypothetical protein